MRKVQYGQKKVIVFFNNICYIQTNIILSKGRKFDYFPPIPKVRPHAGPTRRWGCEDRGHAKKILSEEFFT